MVNIGNKVQRLVNVKKDIDGMETFVKIGKLVLEEEYTIQHFSNVFVKMDIFGMVILAQ